MINSSVAATDRNYVSASVHLQNGQISANMERLLSRTFAQYHDYRCVESLTIANGAMTVVYY